jgi:hypothetical protein
MTKKYKIIFHVGSDLNLKTRGFQGEAWIDQTGLNIQGPMGEVLVKRQDIQKTELCRLHGLGRVIRIENTTGTVCLSGGNFLRTGKLHKELTSIAPQYER